MMTHPTDVSTLSQVSERSLAEFDLIAAAAEADVVAGSLGAEQMESLTGGDPATMLKNGMGFVTGMLRSTMRFGVAAIISDELEWGRVRLPVHGISGGMVFRNFVRYGEALKQRLSPESFAEIEPYLKLMLGLQQRLSARADAEPDGGEL